VREYFNRNNSSDEFSYWLF